MTETSSDDNGGNKRLGTAGIGSSRWFLFQNDVQLLVECARFSSATNGLGWAIPHEARVAASFRRLILLNIQWIKRW